MKSWKKGESDVAKKLEEWWGCKFYRTPSSGGLATIREDSLPPSVIKKMSGDLVCDDDEFPFSIEVKSYQEIPLYSLMTNYDALLWKFWDQTKKQAMRFGLIPLLIFKEDRKQNFVMFPKYLFEAFCKKYKLSVNKQITYLEDHKNFWALAIQKADAVIMSWNIFSENINPEISKMLFNICNNKKSVISK